MSVCDRFIRSLNREFFQLDINEFARFVAAHFKRSAPLYRDMWRDNILDDLEHGTIATVKPELYKDIQEALQTCVPTMKIVVKKVQLGLLSNTIIIYFDATVGDIDMKSILDL
jgi:hypothetical protein